MNFVVKNEHWEQELETGLFADKDGSLDSPIIYLEPQQNMFDALVTAGVFPSKGQARKNWKPTGADIPLGFSLWTGVGKLRQVLVVWLPTPYTWKCPVCQEKACEDRAHELDGLTVCTGT